MHTNKKAKLLPIVKKKKWAVMLNKLELN